jgi:hypothetical protein
MGRHKLDSSRSEYTAAAAYTIMNIAKCGEFFD